MVNGSRFFRSKDAFEVKSLFGQQVIHKDGDRTWERMFHWRMVTLTLAPLSSSTSVCSLSETHLLSILAIWKRVSSTTGTAYSARLSIYDSIQITAAGFWWNYWVENLPQCQNLFLVVSLVLTNIAWVWISLVSRGPIVEAGTQCCFTFSSVTGISLNQLLPSAGMSHNVCWDSYRTQRQEPAVVFSNYG